MLYFYTVICIAECKREVQKITSFQCSFMTYTIVMTSMVVSTYVSINFSVSLQMLSLNEYLQFRFKPKYLIHVTQEIACTKYTVQVILKRISASCVQIEYTQYLPLHFSNHQLIDSSSKFLSGKALLCCYVLGCPYIKDALIQIGFVRNICLEISLVTKIIGSMR